jgi:hypothetical protein
VIKQNAVVDAAGVKARIADGRHGRIVANDARMIRTVTVKTRMALDAAGEGTPYAYASQKLR